MAGFVNNFLESTSTLFSNTWTGLKTNTKNAIQYSYYNYYLKLVASHHFYYDRYKSDIYHAEKTYNTETPAKKGSKHLSLMWMFILPIMPITENPLYISIVIPVLAIITYLDSCFLHIRALVWAHNFLGTIGASIPSIFSFAILTPFTIPAAI